MIKNTYRTLLEKLNGRITVEHLAKVYDASRHPDVLSGKKTSKQVFDEFTLGWGEVDPCQPVPEEAFTAYYHVL